MRAGLVLPLLGLLACGGSTTSDGGTSDLGARDAGAPADAGTPVDGGPPRDAGPPVDAGSPPVGLAARQRALAMALRPGLPPHFLFGLGNDLASDHDMDGAYTLGVTMDLHYTYLVGLSTEGGWVTWNTGGSFPDILDAAAMRHGSTSMFTYYVFGPKYEGSTDPLQDAALMDVYFADLKLLAMRLGALGRPFVVHHEPDSWGYIQQHVEMAGMTADTYAARIHTATFHDCDDLPETVHGFGRCVVRLFRTNAPMVKLGFHASTWAAWYDPIDPSADLAGSANSIAAFLLSAGADETDFIAVDPLDRDAGYWETHAWNPATMREDPTGTCSVDSGGRGYRVYYDESNTTLPNFHQYFTWVRALTAATQLPVIWWQTPLGVPSDTCGGAGGGSDGHYRDNRVRYFFGHVDELVAAGGFAVAFGTGASRQTFIDTDGNQFHDAVNAYYASPTLLP